MYTPKGKFAWYELMTSDTAAAATFYSSVIGWTAQNVGSPEMPYTSFNVEGVGVAGMLHMPQHVAWIGYISVEDVDAHVEKIVEAGGKLWKGPTDVPGMLRFAVMSDPQGAAFVAFTPNPAMPTPANRPVPPALGTISWNELYAGDMETAFDFYATHFGWTKVSDMDMGPMGLYRLFDQGDNLPMGAGGMMTKGAHIPVASWGFYFQVDSANAAIERIKAGGGSILNGPMQVPGGGWIVQAADPQGAHFNVVSSNA